ncbi:MAG TPA: hypothetical protein VGG19_00790 [Tepidisphaeraceae bacterium]|jgi:fibronectin-binding autotransporter adhesin
MKVTAIRVGRSFTATAILLAAATTALATSDNYSGPATGNFNVNSNWSQSLVPTSGEDVYLGNVNTPKITTGNMTVTLNTTEPTTGFYNSLTLDSSALPAFMILNQTAGTLNVGTINIGVTFGDNTYNQSGGSTDSATTLNIGGGTYAANTYNISGTNTTLSMTSSGKINVGVTGGGTFTQSTGTSVSAGNVILGVNSGSSGTYNISGGSLSSNPGPLEVGASGSGTVNQSGGDINVSSIVLGYSTGGTGIYNFSGGTIEGPISINTNSAFNLQTGGVFPGTATVDIGGSFKMAGGSFGTSASIDLEGGSLQLAGYNATLPTFQSLSGGTISNGAGTPSVLTVNMPLETNTPTVVQPFTFVGHIINGFTGSLGLSVTGGPNNGLGLAASNSYSGPTTVTALLQAEAANVFSPNSPVTVNTNGTLDTQGFAETICSLAGTGGVVNIGTGGNLSIGGLNTTTSFSGSLTGTGTITITGGNSTFTNLSDFQGQYLVNGGTLILQGSPVSSNYVVSSGGTLEFQNGIVNVPGAEIYVNSGGTAEYSNSTIENAYLRGAGTNLVLANTQFNGVTTYNSTVITQTGSSTFENFTNGGTFNNNANLTFNGVTNVASGIINVNSNLTTIDFTNEGVINIANGGNLTSNVSDIYLGGGSRTYINADGTGGTVTLSGGATLEVNGALLVNNGEISGPTDINYGSTVEGNGSYGLVNITFGGIFQPGISSGAIIAGNSASISALSGNGTIDNVAAAGNITLNINTNIANTFSGTIQNSHGSLALNLNGGSLTLLTQTVGSSDSINTYTGGTAITSGSLIIAGVGAFPAGSPITNNGSFLIYANSTIGQITGSGNLTVGSNTTSAIATLVPKSGISTLASISIDSGSKLDVTNNDLIIHTGTVAQISGLIASAYGTGNWNGTTGVFSSLAAASARGVITLGVGTGLSTFDGQSVLPTDIEVKYTWVGDANLDGIVDGNDLAAMSSSGTTWQTGDFNYDGKVNADDYALYALGAAESSDVNISTLPEPNVLLIAAPVVMGCFYRRRR